MIWLILSLLVNAVLLYAVINQNRKIEHYETFLEVVRSSLNTSIKSMRSLDYRHAFEADDEVGMIFKGLLGLVSSLDVFLAQEHDEEVFTRPTEDDVIWPRQ